MALTMHETPGAPPGVDNVILVSSDCHIGPTMDQLREYCPKAYLDTFDDFAAGIAKETEAVMSVEGTIAAQMDDALSHMSVEEREAILAMAADNPILQQMMRNRHTDGHFDMDARRRDMDADGLAAEIIFHGSQNGQPVPFVTSHDLNAGLTTPFSFDGMDLELAYVGMHMYNAWLGEQCQTDLNRHVGLAHIPAWDPAKAAEEVRWAHANGLRGVNFPAWRPGMPALQDDAWNVFWEACHELRMPLTNHGGAGDDDKWPEAQKMTLLGLESAYHSKRLIWSLAYNGTFDRYPDLKLMIAEIPGAWWPYLMREMDTSPGAPGRPGDLLSAGSEISKPSEICKTNVYHGATFMSREEAQSAVEHDYVGNIMWGSDYPHVEGTWQAPGEDGLEPQTHLSLRDTFAGIAEEHVRRMVGLNAIEAYNLDETHLQKVANTISAPSFDEINTPLPEDQIPEVHGMFVFRRHGPWA